ncbi:uncharacterized protein K02A2.6-like [Toxorhynchites rutilus septentrionalis]|uniref:uncharacterized protein K02A2.6-like n=1 Tax=Toxorhynchites rutilus septentrionalis TaxID=329112 RepID=UPI00247AA372|nr:uncharacterized protein K02A2.6-like [Toxorhynchites rutilus septentrionalis]
MLAGLKGTSGYLDDVIVGGETEEEHDLNLRGVLKRIQDFGFTIRVDKCSFRKQQIRYLGHIVDSRGLRPDPAKIEAITKLPPPADVSGVRSFLGAINYYGKFVPNMRMLRYPLDNLLKVETKFSWSPECQKAFDRFKQILSSDLLFTHYDPKREIIVSADASSVGLGATISHRFPDGTIKVVQHASRALTKAEQGYSQPDREGLAIIFAVTKFHKMLFGRHFRLQTDHRPLLRIFGSKKGIPVYTANRLQRFALNLLLYDFEIEYVSTEKFGNADLLSRLIDQHIKPEEDYVIASLNLEEDIRSVVINTVKVLPLNFRVVAQSTQADPLLRQVHRYVQNGWPQSTLDGSELRRFQSRQESLSVVDGCILFAERLVIPSLHRKRCLEQLHRGHPGMQRMKAIARSYVYWPTLDADIVSFVKACQQCASVARSPPHSPPVPWPKSTAPWQRVHVDFAGPIEDDYYLLAIDSFSKWPEIIRTTRITSAATISILRGLFARLGMPVTLVSDNGTQFTSAEFADFCASNGIEHLTTAPFHPQSNGQAERFVDTFKRPVKKIREGRGSIEEALDVFLLTYRSTPSRALPDQKSPSEIMFGRKIRTCLELLRPPPVRVPVPTDDDRKQPRSFNRNETVYAKLYGRTGWKWAPGVVVEKIGDVMYNVWVEDRRMLRSHINQLRSRLAAGAIPKQPTVHATLNQHSLPLDILLDAWDLPSQSPGPSSPEPVSSAERTMVDSGPTLATSTPRHEVSAFVPSSASSSSTTTTPTSTEFESAVEVELAVDIPRRSSRLRRPPVRLTAQHKHKNSKEVPRNVYCFCVQVDDKSDEQLEAFAEWCQLNRMSLNASKCSIISFGRQRALIQHNYVLSGISLKRESTVKDLGLLLDSKLTFKDHVAYVVSEASSQLGFMFRFAKEFKDIYCLKALYCSLVRPILEYSAVVWCPYYQNEVNRIEAIQPKFIRFALRHLPWNDVHNLPSYKSRCMLIHLESLEARRTITMACFIGDLYFAVKLF